MRCELMNTVFASFSLKNFSSGSIKMSLIIFIWSAKYFFENFSSRYFNCCPTLLLELWRHISELSDKNFDSLSYFKTWCCNHEPTSWWKCMCLCEQFPCWSVRNITRSEIMSLGSLQDHALTIKLQDLVIALILLDSRKSTKD